MTLTTLADGLRREAERQARDGLKGPQPMKETCTTCALPFKFGHKQDAGTNVYTYAGARETQITGMCEACFDDLFSEDWDYK